MINLKIEEEDNSSDDKKDDGVEFDETSEVDAWKDSH